MSSSRRGPIAFLVRAVIFLVLLTALGELWFRVVMPAAETPAYSPDSDWKIVKFDPREGSAGLYTIGRLTLRGGKWRVNDDGWISAIDYLPGGDRGRPLIALIGDSYIAGYQTDVDDHVDPYLSDALGPGVDVYAFGAAGWYLEEYLAVSRYVVATYKPDLLVVFIGRGDVAKSIRENGVVSPNFWQVATSGDGFSEVAPTSMVAPSRLVLWARYSAIARYLRHNVKIKLPGMQNAAIADDAGPDPTGGDSVVPGEDIEWQALLPAARYMVDRFRAENPGVPVVFAARGSPGEWRLSMEELARTPAVADALAIEAACVGRPDCYYLDMRTAFCSDWALNHHSFVTADDFHWNAYANRLVAETLAKLVDENGLLSGARGGTVAE